jgi:hypothetical protein
MKDISPTQPQAIPARCTGWSNTVQMAANCAFGAANAVRAYNGGGKVDLCLQKSIVNIGDGRAYWSSSESQAPGFNRFALIVADVNNCNFERPESKRLGRFRVRPIRAF